MSEAIALLAESHRRSMFLGRCKFQGNPAWCCRLTEPRDMPHTEGFDVTEYASDPETAISAAVKRARGQ